ncbi:hypothetical protein DL96DRAFT_1715889 [Flagelloscypha sp. PMI_526]|nr:hypothetical protein DL96DRAFT_1715889 [Flagelloscypha sp. PMI_526]
MHILELPYELHMAISTSLGQVSSSPQIARKTRLACCLVCHSMRAFYQPPFYTSVTFKGTKDAHSFSNDATRTYNHRITLFYRTISEEASKHLALLVTHLQLEHESLLPFPDSRLPDLPPFLPSVRHLSIIWNTSRSAPATWSKVVDKNFVSSAEKAWGDSLERLEVTNFIRFPHSTLIPSFRALRYLSLLGVVNDIIPSSKPSKRATFKRLLGAKPKNKATPDEPPLENVVETLWISTQRYPAYHGSTPIIRSGTPSCRITSLLDLEIPTLQEVRLEPSEDEMRVVRTGFSIPYSQLPHLRCLVFTLPINARTVQQIKKSLPSSRSEAENLEALIIEPTSYQRGLKGDLLWVEFDNQLAELGLRVRIVFTHREFGVYEKENWDTNLVQCKAKGKLSYGYRARGLPSRIYGEEPLEGMLWDLSQCWFGKTSLETPEEDSGDEAQEEEVSSS